MSLFDKKIKNNRGVILLMTLLILSSILIVTLGAADLVLAGIKMNRQSGYSGIAFFSSEAGMERALWGARKNSLDLSGGDSDDILKCDSNQTLCTLANGSTYKVSYIQAGGNKTFKSIGSFQGVKRSVESTYSD